MPPAALTLARLAAGPDPGPPDRELLRAFAAGSIAGGLSPPAPPADDPFAELVRRHGPMVLAACRRALGNPHDAEDAFQATFLVLARKAHTVRGNLAAWLYAVAVRTARGVRIMRDRRRKHSVRSQETGVRNQEAAPHSDAHILVTEQAAIIDEELAKLADHYREAVVLCELRGLSRKQAAAELGIPEGTLSSRLATAKRKLAALLAARGLTAPAVLVLAPTAVSANLVTAAVAAARGAAGPVASAAASTVVKGMLFDQLRTVTLAAGILLTAVCGGLAVTGSPGDQGGPAVAPAPRPADHGKLVEQLGAPEFADREAAAKALRELGFAAEAALRAGLRSDNPETRDRAAKLLTAIRADARDRLVKAFDPAADAPEPDHPLWKRFKTIAGNDAPARKLFAELIADPRRLKLLDDADRDPDKAGDLYAAELERWYKFVQKLLARPGTRVPDAAETPYPEAVAVMYLGTYPSSAGKAKEGWRWEGHLFIESWDELVKSAVGPAVRRVFAAWIPVRDGDARERGLAIATNHRIREALPFARTALADETEPPLHRAQAALLLGAAGAPADLAPLRRAAESEPANKPFDRFNVVLKGQAELDSLWGRVKHGDKVDPEESRRIWKEADIRTCDRTVADCAWAAAVRLAGGKPEDLGFCWSRTVLGREVNDYWFGIAHIHGFPDDKSRAAAHAKAKAFLDEQPKEKQDPPQSDPAVVKLVEQLGAPEFADREAAEKALRELGVKAKPALRAGLKSDSPEVRDRAAKALAAVRRDQIRDVFARIAGDAPAARDLFAKIMSSQRGVAALEAVLDDPARADEAYRTRTAELMRVAAGHPPVDADGKASVPTAPDVWAAPPPPLGDVAGWLLLGAIQPGTAPWADYTVRGWEHRLGTAVPFLPEDDHTSAKPIAAAYAAPDAAPLKKLTAAWLAKRRENDMLRAALALAIRYDIGDALPAARTLLKDPKPTDIHSPNLAGVAVLVGLHGTKDDLPLLARHAADDRSFGTWMNLPPGTDLTFTPPVKEGRDLFCHVRDAVAATMCKLAGKGPADFGLPAFPQTKHPDGAPMSLMSATKVGFTTKADREKAFGKAAAWLKSFEPAGPKQPEPDPAVVKLVEQLGAPDFADREAAEKELRKLGLAAEAALKAGLRSETPEVRDRAAKLLIAVRADSRDALVKAFDPAKKELPDHPLWRRFKGIAGDTPASRDLFARIISNPQWLRTLDAIEADPAAARLYREEFVAIGRMRIDERLRPPYPFWQQIEGVAYLLFLGSYPDTFRAQPDPPDPDDRCAMLAEVNFASGDPVYCALRGEQVTYVIDPGHPNAPKLKDAVPGTDRVIVRLLAAWLPNRTHPDTLTNGFSVATSRGVEGVLPFARRVAADTKQPAEVRCRALEAVAKFGTPADLPLFEPLYTDETVVVTIELWPFHQGNPKIEGFAKVQARDVAVGLSLALRGEDPRAYGFKMARRRPLQKPDERQAAADYLLESFGFPDGEDAAHEKAREWLDKRK